MDYSPLTRDEVRSVIQGKAKTRRVPIDIHFWVHAGRFGDREERVREILAHYPEDLQMVQFTMPSLYRSDSDSDYSWLPYANPNQGQTVAYDEAVGVPNWENLDDILEQFPAPDYDGLFSAAPESDGRYRLAQWFFCLFERHWELRGMTNALIDYYEYPDEVHRLFRALTDFYAEIIRRAAAEQRCDGLWTSDDLGTQTGGFFSPGIFSEFFLPYYSELIQCAHNSGMEFWMHACGDVREYIPGWLDAGLDVLHPIQKHAMDEREIVERHGDRLTVFSGLDVQQVIPWGTPDEVRQEVRFLLDTFWQPGVGRCMLTAGNGVNEDCTLESLEALFDEAMTYGAKIVT